LDSLFKTGKAGTQRYCVIPGIRLGSAPGRARIWDGLVRLGKVNLG